MFVNIGRSLTLPCHGAPSRDVEWRFQEYEYPDWLGVADLYTGSFSSGNGFQGRVESFHLKDPGNYSLLLSPVVYSDLGIYKCQYIDETEIILSDVKLEIRVPSNVFVAMGMSASLPCFAQINTRARADDLDILWKRGGENVYQLLKNTITYGPRFENRASVSPEQALYGNMSLTIRQTRFSDEGDYQCFYNGPKENPDSASLVVTGHPPQNLTVKAGGLLSIPLYTADPVRVTFSAGLGSDEVLMLDANKGPARYGERCAQRCELLAQNYTLLLRSVTLEDAGVYKVTDPETNRTIGSVSVRVSALLAASPVYSDRMFVNIGRSLTLPCHGAPSRDVEWRFQQYGYPDWLYVADLYTGSFSSGNGFQGRVESFHLKNPGNYSLTLRPVVYSDLGFYKCQYIDGIGIILSDVKLEIGEPSDVSVAMGMSATLPCFGKINIQARAVDLDILWKRGGENVYQLLKNTTTYGPRFENRASVSPEQAVYGNMSLTIRQTRCSDEGDYQCFYNSPKERGNPDSASLVVTGHPPQNLTVKAGGLLSIPLYTADPVRVTFSAGLGSDEVLMLDANKGPARYGERCAQRCELLTQDYTLLLRRVTREDAGVYKVTDPETSRTIGSVSLEVSALLPAFPVYSVHMFVNIGRSLTLACHGDHSRDVEWRFQQYEYPDCLVVADLYTGSFSSGNGFQGRVESFYLKDPGNYSLLLSPVVYSDLGIYKCQYRDETEIVLSDVKLEIREPSNVSVAMGMSATLPCFGKINIQARAVDLDILWKRGGENVYQLLKNTTTYGPRFENRASVSPEQAVYGNMSLTIRQTRCSDEGDYQCFYNSPKERGNPDSASLVVTGHPPQNLTVKAGGLLSIPLYTADPVRVTFSAGLGSDEVLMLDANKGPARYGERCAQRCELLAQNYTLLLRSVTLEDAGVYKVTNPETNRTIGSVSLEVSALLAASPVYSVCMFVSLGLSLTLPCHGDHSRDVEWRFQEYGYPDWLDVAVLHTGSFSSGNGFQGRVESFYLKDPGNYSLTLSPVVYSDLGIYKCQYRDETEIILFDVKLEIRVPSNVSVAMGMSASLPCFGKINTQARADDLDILWKRGGENVYQLLKNTITYGPGFENRASVSPEQALYGNMSLTIRQTRFSDEGDYQCFYNSPKERQKRGNPDSASLVVTGHPHQNLTVKAGGLLSILLYTADPVRVTFSAGLGSDEVLMLDSNKGPARYGKRCAQRCELLAQEYTLLLRSVTLEDAGVYKVTDPETNKTISSVSLEVSALLAASPVYSVRMFVSFGRSLTLPCHGAPSRDVEWRFQQYGYPEWLLVAVLYTGPFSSGNGFQRRVESFHLKEPGNYSLLLGPVVYSDLGIYKCQYRDETEIVLSDVKLEIGVPSDVSVAMGMSASLLCFGKINMQARADDLDILWKRGGENVYQLLENTITYGPGFENRASVSPEQALYGNMSLIIRQARFSDEGDYQCFYNSLKERGNPDSASLVVTGHPPQNLTVKAGGLLSIPLYTADPVRVTFSAGLGSDEVLMLDANKGPARYGERCAQRCELLAQNYTLLLRSVTLEDAGVYKVTNPETNRTIGSVSLEVSALLAESPVYSVRMFVNIGRSLTLPCRGTPSRDVTWSFQEYGYPDWLDVADLYTGSFSSGNGFQRRVESFYLKDPGNYNLLLSPVVYSDFGIYKCQYYNDEIILSDVKLDIREPSNVSVAMGMSASLPCFGKINMQARADDLDILWKRDGENIYQLLNNTITYGPGFENRASVSPEQALYGNMSLTIRQTRFSDEGDYQCFYNSPKERGNPDSASLVVTGHPPQNLTVEAGGLLSILLYTADPVRVTFSAGLGSDEVLMLDANKGPARYGERCAQRCEFLAQNYTLLLKSVTLEDAGFYKVTNPETNKTIGSVSVRVSALLAASPVYSVGMFVSFGRSLPLPCHGAPSRDVTWRFQEYEYPDWLGVADLYTGSFSSGDGFQGRVESFYLKDPGNYSLLLSPVVYSDLGIYKCQYRDETEIILSDVKLEIREPSNVSVAMGMSATLPCFGKISMQARADDLDILWKRGGENVYQLLKNTITYGPGFENRASVSPEQAIYGNMSLTIRQTRFSDEGDYQCFYNSPKERGNPDSASLVVTGHPPQNLTVKAGGLLSILLYTADPVRVTFSAGFGSDEVPMLDANKGSARYGERCAQRCELLAQNYTLLLRSVTLEDAGVYKVTDPETNRTIGSVSLEVSALLAASPVYSDPMFVNIGHSLTLPCRGAPSRNVTWRFQQYGYPDWLDVADLYTGSFSSGNGFQGRVECFHLKEPGNYSLLLGPVVYSDLGIYKCQYIDGIGIILSDVKLEIRALLAASPVYSDRMFVDIGRSLTLPCRGAPRRDVTWWFQQYEYPDWLLVAGLHNRSISTGNGFQGRVESFYLKNPGNYSLTLSPVVYSDLGIYRCQYKDETEIILSDVKLNIREPSNVSVAMGMSASLPCFGKINTRARADDLDILWKRGGENVYQLHKNIITYGLGFENRASVSPEQAVYGNMSLTIRQTRFSDEGDYQCFYNSPKVRGNPDSASLVVTGHPPQTLTVKAGGLLSIPLYTADPVRVTFSAGLGSDEVLMLDANKGPARYGERCAQRCELLAQEYTLLLRSVTLEDAGVYKVTDPETNRTIGSVSLEVSGRSAGAVAGIVVGVLVLAGSAFAVWKFFRNLQNSVHFRAARAEDH
ncbi:uncharacterized protein LOC135245440 [Anguilla rostrata]|uniref:uncharacterized protein LOC135245440 n=1 Tax=Anguilla rostrata TaxID=7938 RepID=UPI0030D604CC